MEDAHNKHAGSSFDSFLKEEGIEILEKKCPRCGGASANSGNASGRCSACLKKLASNKKKVGHYLHEHKVADDALRRQNGKNGTASKKSKGRGSRKDIIAKVKAGEKKAGTVLSPDRKDNSKGYSSSNTRMVPPKLNRGRHHVDGKKLRAWQKRLKKSDTSDEEFYTYMLAKAEEFGDQELLTLLQDMHYNDLANFINNEDESEAVSVEPSQE
jgi:ribosomal protein S27AE